MSRHAIEYKRIASGFVSIFLRLRASRSLRCFFGVRAVPNRRPYAGQIYPVWSWTCVLRAGGRVGRCWIGRSPSRFSCRLPRGRLRLP
jgi:hypothetical protein